MKSFLLSFVLLSIVSTGFAQAKTETLKVSGECGSCKKKIEAAAKKAGASYAVWDVDTKELTIKYNTSVNSAKIQKAIADAGYDTPDYKATDEAYNKLDGCCQYERTTLKEKGDAKKE
jgi:copper chaperone CopZ